MRRKLSCSSVIMLLLLAAAPCYAFDNASSEISMLDATGEWWSHPERSMTFLAVGDTNNDGHDDLLIGMNSFPDANEGWIYNSKPVLLVYDPKTSQYIVDTSFRDNVPKHIWSRRGLISDLNNDGQTEIFIGGHGSDGWGFAMCGEQNILMTRNGDQWTNVTSLLPQTSDFSHGLAHGDFDGDQTTDLLVINSPYVNKDKCSSTINPSNRSYFFGYEDSENGKELEIKVNEKDLNLTNTRSFEEIHSGLAALLDNDEKPDLVFGTNLGLYILENRGWGKYVRAASFKPPTALLRIAEDVGCMESSGVCNTPYSDFVTYDVDADGNLEVIASLAFQRDNGSWTGQHFQVLKRQNKKWKDITSSIFPSQNMGPFEGHEWCMSLSVVDINNDGNADIVCNSATNMGLRDGLELYFIFEGGQFRPLSSLSTESELQEKLKNLAQKHPVLVGKANLNGVPNLIAIFQLWVDESGKGETIKSFKIRALPLE